MPEIKRKNGKSGTNLLCGEGLVNNDLKPKRIELRSFCPKVDSPESVR